MRLYNNLAGHWRARLGGAARKVPLDAGMDCPNRDGTVSRDGCVFCNPRGSGTGLASEEPGGLSLAAQWERAAPRPGASGAVRRIARPVAYLQSFTNTHCSPERLASVLDEMAVLPGMAGACIGTRPDCLEQPKLDLLAAFARRLAASVPEGEVWLDLGLQSSHDATLARINRGHDAACFAHAARRAAGAGLKVCAHVMFGLPAGVDPGNERGHEPRAGKGIGGRAGSFPCPSEKHARSEAQAAPMAIEGPEALWRSVDFLSALPVSGVKFHNTMVVCGTRLETWWRQGRYTPPAMEDYAVAVAHALARLRPDVVVHRLAADPAPGELVAPDWAARKHDVLARIRAVMEAQGLRQGSRWGSRNGGL